MISKFNNKGFTLVEVLVTVVLMSIIITISFGAYNLIINNSKNKAIEVSKDNIMNAAELYLKEDVDYSYWGHHDLNDSTYYYYYCISIQELINKGFFGEDLLNKKIKSDGGITNNSLIKIVKNMNNMTIVKTEITDLTNVNECLNETNGDIDNDNDDPLSDENYHLLFESNGDVVIAPYSIRKGNSVSLPSATKNGYLFAGWYTRKFSGTKVGDANTTITPKYDMILYAHWVPDPNIPRVNIKLDMNGGDLASTHEEGIDKSGTLLTYNNSTIIHQVIHVDKSGLLNWKNNIKRDGYSINENKAWCMERNGTGKCYSLTKEYKSTDFCQNKNENCTITLYANWIPSKIKIIFNANGGILASEHNVNYSIDDDYVTKNNNVIIHTIEYGNSLTENGLLNWNNKNGLNMFKTGYTINSNSVWCLNAETCFDQVTAYEGSKFCDAKEGDCEAELYANWVPNTYTITLDNEGATTNGTSTLYEEYNKNWYLDTGKTKIMTSEENPIVMPTKTGYTFDGYYTEKYGEGNQVITEEGYIVGNKTNTFSANGKLYANWNALDYTINYYIGNADGSTPTKLNSQKCTFGNTCTLVDFAELVDKFPYSSADSGGKYGWSFYGWSTSKEGLTLSYNNKASLSGLTTYSSTINIYALGKKTYRFSTGKEPKSFILTVNQIWNPIGIEDKYLTDIDVPNAESLSSWTFIGYIGGSNSVANENVCIPAAKAGAKYKPKYNECSTGYMRSKYKRTLTITYDGNSGTGTTNKTELVQLYNSGYGNNAGDTNTGSTLGSNSIKLANNNFTRTNYLFTKWRTAKTSGTLYAEGDTFEELGTTIDSTKLTQTMYAQWEEDLPEDATLIYYANGHGTAPAKVTMTYSAATKAAAAITATGYTFKEWNTKADGTGTSYLAGATVKAANVTPVKTSLYAQWTEKTAKLTYNANGHGTAPSAVTMKYSIETKAAAAITATGYTFNGWNTKTDGTGTNYAAGATVKAANVEPTAKTLYAKWTEKTAKLTYNANGHGTAPSAVTMKYSAATTAAAAITAGGYTFNGWNTKADGTGTNYVAGATVKAANVEPTAKTLYAKWTAVDPTITFSKGGTSSSPTKVRSGVDITVTCTSAAGISSLDIVDDLGDHGTLSKPSSTEWKRTDELGKERDNAYIKATCKSKNGESKTVTKYYNVKNATPSISFSPAGGTSSSPKSVAKGSTITITCTSSFTISSFSTVDDTGDKGSQSSKTNTKVVRKITLGSVRSGAYIKATCNDGVSKTVKKYYKVTSSSSGGSSSCSGSSSSTKGTCICYDMEQCHIVGSTYSSYTKEQCCDKCGKNSYQWNTTVPPC
ncbi:MAG: InlB B-repeat-containing protein [Bacilli bacterium]|nr:InlB B-repeat-containing protein [Bacilli bacterium]